MSSSPLQSENCVETPSFATLPHIPKYVNRKRPYKWFGSGVIGCGSGIIGCGSGVMGNEVWFKRPILTCIN